METQNKYDKYVVSEEAPLLNWLLANLKLSRTKSRISFMDRESE